MNIAVLLAAGSSQRAKQDKLWVEVLGQPLWTLAHHALNAHSQIHRILLVVPKGQIQKFQVHVGPKTRIVEGGSTRMQSFKNALKVVDWKSANLILDHNAANPKLSPQEITQVLNAAARHGAAALSHPAVDTLITEENGFYHEVIPREKVRHMQTPQAVQAKLLKKIDLKNETDLTSALLKVTKVKCVEADPANKKITTPEDLNALTARAFLGEDSHRFQKSGTLKLGGLTLPDFPALEANSDGDVVLHAIGRALAQAQGKNFSESADALHKKGQKDSAAYLKPFLKGLQIHRVSIQLECSRPRIDGLPLTQSLSKILKIPKECIQISAMTGEGLTPFGRGEGIRCLCLLQCT